jgi:hypothetical protein
MPIAAENARWSNTGTQANADEARKSQGAKEHTGQEGQNASSPARTFESRISQAV